MTRLHKKLLKKYRWYEVWHGRRGHSVYHWIALVIVLIPVALVAMNVLTLKILQSDRLLANLRGPQTPFPTMKGGITSVAGDHILVAFRNSTGQNERASIMKRQHLTEKSTLGPIGVDMLAIDSSEKPLDVVTRLIAQESRAIEFAEVDAQVEPSFTPNDPDYPNEWHHNTINSPAAWDATRGENITIAIADTGVDSSQPDLAAHLVPGWNFYDNNADTSDVYGHGTAVAGTATAIGDNATEVAGVAYNANIMPLRISDANGYSYSSIIANAITYAADHGVKIVNVSYQIGGSQTISRAARYLNNAGGILVASEGNTGTQSGYANDKNIINVAATDMSDSFASWSTYGNDVDVSAPGLAILTTALGGGTVYYSGTSFSAPIVSGVIALMWSANPPLTPGDITKVLYNSASDLGPTGWDEHYGWGRVDAGAAVAAALQATPTVSTGGRKK